MKIGMLTSGGDCQGLNAALRGVAKALYQEFGTAVTIYGIRDGYRGLIEGDYHPMEPQDFSDILTRGGTILGTSRQPFKTMQQAEENEATKLEKMLDTCRRARFDCLVILGGNGTHKTANLLSEHGIPEDHRQRPLGHAGDVRLPVGHEHRRGGHRFHPFHGVLAQPRVYRGDHGT